MKSEGWLYINFNIRIMLLLLLTQLPVPMPLPPSEPVLQVGYAPGSPPPIVKPSR